MPRARPTLRALWLAHERFVALLAEQGVRLDGATIRTAIPTAQSPHFSGPSLDRKPSPYNLFVAAAQFDLDLAGSWMIGDRETDVACAVAAQVKPILISPQCGDGDLVQVPDFPAAAGVILKSSVRPG